jgi:hypothetical protein
VRKIAAVAASAVVLTAGLQAPAWAAAPATDFELAWQGKQLHLSWKDDGGQNIVLVEYADMQEEPFLFENQPAGGPNEITKIPSLYSSDKARFILRTVAADGSSEDTLSPWFDTRRPAAPTLQDATLGTNLTTQLTWKQAAAVEDKTPGDPLDVPGGETVTAQASGTGTLYPFAAGTTSGTIPAQARPTAIALMGWNEWGGGSSATKIVRLGTLGAGITVPASAVYGARLGIKSTLDLFTSQGREERASGIKVELQARGKTADAWKTYGRYAGNTMTAFDTEIAAQGNRQYRLFVPARKVVSGNVIVLTPATSTSAKSSKTVVKFASAGFSPATARVGTRVTLSAKIQPASTVKGRLQFWDGKSWLDASPVQFTKGVFSERGGPETERGSARFRITVPAVTVNGLTVSAATSSAFTLTIR